MPHGDHWVKSVANNPENDKNKQCYFFNLYLLLMIFYVKTCLGCLQELSKINDKQKVKLRFHC